MSVFKQVLLSVLLLLTVGVEGFKSAGGSAEASPPKAASAGGAPAAPSAGAKQAGKVEDVAELFKKVKDFASFKALSGYTQTGVLEALAWPFTAKDVETHLAKEGSSPSAAAAIAPIEVETVKLDQHVLYVTLIGGMLAAWSDLPAKDARGHVYSEQVHYALLRDQVLRGRVLGMSAGAWILVSVSALVVVGALVFLCCLGGPKKQQSAMISPA
jgi:hypothetical protein